MLRCSGYVLPSVRGAAGRVPRGEGGEGPGSASEARRSRLLRAGRDSGSDCFATLRGSVPPAPAWDGIGRGEGARGRWRGAVRVTAPGRSVDGPERDRVAVL